MYGLGFPTGSLHKDVGLLVLSAAYLSLYLELRDPLKAICRSSGYGPRFRAARPHVERRAAFFSCGKIGVSTMSSTAPLYPLS